MGQTECVVGGCAMATIFTIHGTNATGPETGERWWQKGSPFAQCLSELVEAEDGVLKFRPLIWDGMNSEVSRRTAGAQLYRDMCGVEKAGEAYCAIGHSHGGSVTAAALLLAAARGTPLSNLSRWLTVGTPFIEMRKQRWLFSRLGTLGKTAYVSMLSFFAVLCGLLIYQPPREGAGIDLVLVGILLFAFLVPFLLLSFWLWFLNSRALFGYRRKVKAAFKDVYSGRWLALWHGSDEAIQGLRALGGVSLPIFSPRFAVPLLSFLAIFAWPALILYAVSSGDLVSSLAAQFKPPAPDVRLYTPEGTLIGGGNDWRVNVHFLVVFGANYFLATYPAGTKALATFVAGPVVYILVSLILVMVTGALAAGISHLLSGVLDRVAWQQIRRSALGNDMVGEALVDVREHHAGLAATYPPLPAPLADEISAWSDAAAAASLAKVRAAIGRLAFSESDRSKADVVSEYLTWNELIHSAYFNVPRFQKLVAYAIAQSPGFRPSAKFHADPDYATIADWFEMLRPRSVG